MTIVETEPPESPVSVAVQNRSSIDVPAERLADLAAATLAAESVSGPAHLDLVFVDRDEMASLNAAHMGADGPTDVLSFPLDTEPARPGGPPRLVGDLVVCPDYAQGSTAVLDDTRDWDVDDELALLVVHGVLHLVGYDHAEPDERVSMQTREVELLADLANVAYVPGPETTR